MHIEVGVTTVLECTYARREQRLSLLEALLDVPAAPLWVVEFFISPDAPARDVSEWLRHQPRTVQRDRWAEAGRGWD
jgi:hypothetical protein